MWDTKLMTTNSFLNYFSEIQRRWLYLEPVFCRGVFPNEKAAFMTTHNEIISKLSQAKSLKSIVQFATKKGLVENLERILQRLQSSQKALSSYLEEKRDSFSRFFFLGDDDLLEILGQKLAVENHLRKLFAGIAALEIKTDIESYAITIKSLTGEKIPLSNNILIQETPENWLTELSNEVKKILKNLLRSSKNDPESLPGQIMCLKEQISFCEKAEKAITKPGALDSLKTQLTNQIAQFAGSKSSDSDPVLNEKITALILDAVHHRIVFQFFNRNFLNYREKILIK